MAYGYCWVVRGGVFETSRFAPVPSDKHGVLARGGYEPYIHLPLWHPPRAMTTPLRMT
jgi:hypothetical protein